MFDPAAAKKRCEAQKKLEAIQQEVDETSDTENGLWATLRAIRAILRGSKEDE